MNDYNFEVKQRFGETEAYKEYAQKTANYSNDKWQKANEGLSAIFAKFAECMKSGKAPNSPEAQALVKELKGYITENFYTCTKEILESLGVMYALDERFKNNIDSYADGTADFVAESIVAFCLAN